MSSPTEAASSSSGWRRRGGLQICVASLSSSAVSGLAESEGARSGGGGGGSSRSPSSTSPTTPPGGAIITPAFTPSLHRAAELGDRRLMQRLLSSRLSLAGSRDSSPQQSRRSNNSSSSPRTINSGSSAACWEHQCEPHHAAALPPGITTAIGPWGYSLLSDTTRSSRSCDDGGRNGREAGALTRRPAGPRRCHRRPVVGEAGAASADDAEPQPQSLETVVTGDASPRATSMVARPCPPLLLGEVSVTASPPSVFHRQRFPSRRRESSYAYRASLATSSSSGCSSSRPHHHQARIISGR